MEIKLSFTEAKIARVHRGKYGFLSITLQLKPEDYTVDNRAVLESAADEGEIVAVGLTNMGLTVEPKPKKDRSIYQDFKFFCESHGVDYPAEKKRMGVEHLKELIFTMSEVEAENMLRDRMFEIKNELGFYNPEP